MEYNCYGQPIGPSLKKSCFRELNATIIEGSTCDLIRASESHAHLFYTDIFKKGLTPPDWTYLPFSSFQSEEEFSNIFNKTFLSDDPYFFGIWNKEHSKVLGTLSLMRNDRQNGVIEVGYVIYSQQLKKSIQATEAQYLLAKYVFENLGYRRYEWKCDSLNEPSKLAAKRLGFEYEGTFRQAVVYKNRNRDTSWFSMLDCEWEKNKKRLEKWLSPDNFDQDGKQLLSLNNLK